MTCVKLVGIVALGVHFISLFKAGVAFLKTDRCFGGLYGIDFMLDFGRMLAGARYLEARTTRIS